jgi:agmatinase
MEHLLRRSCLIWENLYEPEEADVLLLGVPFDSTHTGIPGTRLAPNQIRLDFQSLYGYQPGGLGDLSDVRLHDFGNVEVVHGDVKATHERIREVVRGILETNSKAKLITLGGEHSITYPVVKELAKKKKGFSYTCFDAHWDLLDDYDGVKYSHTTVNRRVYEQLLGNAEVLGVRTGEKEEYEFSKKLKAAAKGDKQYVSIDVDVMAGVPVGCPVAGGWTLDELWGKVKGREIVACDVVEYNPLVGNSIAMAELVKRLILLLSKQKL